MNSEPTESRTFDYVSAGVRLRLKAIQATRPDGLALEPAAGHASPPTLVFLHDSLGSIETWRDFPDRMAEAVGLDGLIYDRRGHGESDPFAPGPRSACYLHDEAAVLARLLEAQGVGEAVLFGHSDGATIALLAAALFARGLRAVIVEGGHVFVEEPTLAGLREAAAALHATDLLARLARYHGDKAEALASAWLETWLSPQFRDWNIESELRSIHCPVLVLQGERDEYGTEAQVRAITAGVAGPACAQLFPGVGHVPHRDVADGVIRVCAEFLHEYAAGG